MENKPAADREPKEISEIGKIARYFGFRPIIPPSLDKKDFENTKDLDPASNPAEKAAILRIFLEEKTLSQPAMIFCGRPFPGSKEKKKTSRLEGVLMSFGSTKSVCECLSLQTGMTMLNEIGFKNLTVQINSVGDKESVDELHRKLSAFIRKNYNNFPADLRQALKKDPFVILKEQKEEWQNFRAECPKPIDFLSETSRVRFKEVLEFLEIMEIPYEINCGSVGDAIIGSETVFSIFGEDRELASGFCFNKLAKRIGYKKDLPGCVLNISSPLKKKVRKTKNRPVKNHFYLVQFSPEAKLKSFLILRELYKAGANVLHLIARDKLSGQINVAENSEVPYIILIGQKEALENSVIIRDTATHAQELVPITSLAVRAKELVKNLK